jgi:orotate phosphoribosyltransferase
MERGQGELSAVQEVQQAYGIPVVAVASLDDLLAYLGGRPELAQNLRAVFEYRRQYGIKT